MYTPLGSAGKRSISVGGTAAVCTTRPLRSSTRTGVPVAMPSKCSVSDCTAYHTRAYLVVLNGISGRETVLQPASSLASTSFMASHP